MSAASRVATMLRTHTLAESTINGHNTDDAIFDTSELALLKRFCNDPSLKDEILRDNDMLDEPGDVPGTKAQKNRGSLAGFAIAHHGTERPALEQREIQMLKEWFDSGAAGI